MNRANPFWENTSQKGKGVETLNNTVVEPCETQLEVLGTIPVSHVKEILHFPGAGAQAVN